MLFSHANRLYVRRMLRGRATRVALLLFVVINFLDVLRTHRNVVYGEQQRHLYTRHGGDASTRRPRERIYIASQHWNNEEVLRKWWVPAVLKLTETFGEDNVFVSVFESGSWDGSKAALTVLDEELERRGVARNIELSDITHRDELLNEEKGEGWIDTPRGFRELRRIPYLARLRNRTIKDLVELSKKGVTFDKVLFLNDVVFTTEDVLTLLNTNKGEYAAACSMDFKKPPEYYDTFALRDAEGNPHVMQTWPYFRARRSRNAMAHHLDAVPVTSCWNGIVAMKAEPFTSSAKLRFRAVSDSLAAHHLEGSECCLIHADNPLSKTMGVYLNPRVRVGYNREAYDGVHQDEDGAPGWLTTWDVAKGIWTNRFRRWWTMHMLERWAVRSRVGRWEGESVGNREPGEFCLINEMQVLVENGWAHV